MNLGLNIKKSKSQINWGSTLQRNQQCANEFSGTSVVVLACFSSIITGFSIVGHDFPAVLLRPGILGCSTYFPPLIVEFRAIFVFCRCILDGPVVNIFLICDFVVVVGVHFINEFINPCSPSFASGRESRLNGGHGAKGSEKNKCKFHLSN